MLGHSKIDVLKMDIEGAEYDVIDDIMYLDIPIKQICIEFHHRFDTIGVGKTIEAIEKLSKKGYRIFSYSKNFEELSFIKKA